MTIEDCRFTRRVKGTRRSEDADDEASRQHLDLVLQGMRALGHVEQGLLSFVSWGAFRERFGRRMCEWSSATLQGK